MEEITETHERVSGEAESANDLSLRISVRVRLADLQSRPDLNGTAGTLVDFDGDKGRWIVRLARNAETKLFKPANLVRLTTDDEGSPTTMETFEAAAAVVAAQPGITKIAADTGAEDDDGSTVLLDIDEVSHPSTRSRHRRRKAALASKRQAATTGSVVDVETTPASTHDKAVQTTNGSDAARIRELELKVETLGDLVKSLLCNNRHSDASPGAASSTLAQPSNITDRIEFLERMEEEHSKMLVLKCKSDAEMMDDLSKLKEDWADVRGKVEYCVQCLDESDSDEHEVDEDGGYDESAGEDNSIQPVPDEIRKLPYKERMARLGYNVM